MIRLNWYHSILQFSLMIFICAPQILKANEWRYGLGIGYGGTGIQRQYQVEGVNYPVQRSENPGVLSFFVDRQLADHHLLGIEHSRGFRMGPFSSGVTFSGLSYRWFPLSPALAYREQSETHARLIIRQFIPFIGSALGIASGAITRENDKVPRISASGIYMGFKMGVDYPLRPGRGSRIQFNYDTTFFSQESNSGTLNQFSLQWGYYFVY